MKIFALCGSLRQNSSNWSLILAAQNFMKDHQWTVFNLADLPYFDPDNQFSDKTPSIVTEMRTLASHADLIFISTPEYAHGIPGILKNGLEWLFFEGTQKKRVAVVIGSSQGEYAQVQLLEIINTMDFNFSENDCLIIKGARKKVDSQGQFLNDEAKLKFENFCLQLV
jgi:chromate reductase, NAD(P)H dehydrogenase (quinone)